MSGKNTFKKIQKGIKESRRRTVSALRKTDERINAIIDLDVIAIFCSDLHLSLNPPIWRSTEKDWFGAMLRPLDEIKKIQTKNNNCPVICAGDIFDKWNSPPEIINFALKHLPDMYTIPGQHDLPLHNYKDIEKSAYWTLVEAGKVIHKKRIIMKGIEVKFFPFGEKIKPLPLKSAHALHIAVCHEYRCIKDKDFPKAPKDAYVRSDEKNLLGYDIILYGDNHQGFQLLINNKKTLVFNCGSLIRRKSDEVHYQPQIGLLLESGEVIPYYLDTSKDKYLEIERTAGVDDVPDMRELIQELEKLDNTDLDFTDVMAQYLQNNKIKKPICDIIKKAMDSCLH